MKKKFTKEEFDGLDYEEFEVTWSKRQDYGNAIYQDGSGKFWSFGATSDYDWGIEIQDYTGTLVERKKKIVETEEWVEVDN